jgi:hypothetical protein
MKELWELKKELIDNRQELEIKRNRKMSENSDSSFLSNKKTEWIDKLRDKRLEKLKNVEGNRCAYIGGLDFMNEWKIYQELENIDNNAFGNTLNCLLKNPIMDPDYNEAIKEIKQFSRSIGE